MNNINRISNSFTSEKNLGGEGFRNTTKNFMNQNKTFKSRMRFDSRYTEDMQTIQKIDYHKFIHEYGQSFFTKKEFKDLDLPDTKNFKQLSRTGSFTIENAVNNSRMNSLNEEGFTGFTALSHFTNKSFSMMKQKYKKFKKRLVPIIVLVLLLIFLTVVIFSKN
jgi:hypothetical protein